MTKSFEEFLEKDSYSSPSDKTLGACAVGIHGCKSALIHALGRSISLNIH